MHKKGAEESKPDSNFEDREFLQGKDLSNMTSYERPPLPAGLSDVKDDIEFMQIDCDTYTT
jgi:hypothetical protein